MSADTLVDSWNLVNHHRISEYHHVQWWKCRNQCKCAPLITIITYILLHLVWRNDGPEFHAQPVDCIETRIKIEEKTCNITIFNVYSFIVFVSFCFNQTQHNCCYTDVFNTWSLFIHTRSMKRPLVSQKQSAQWRL